MGSQLLPVTFETSAANKRRKLLLLVHSEETEQSSNRCLGVSLLLGVHLSEGDFFLFRTIQPLILPLLDHSSLSFSLDRGELILHFMYTKTAGGHICVDNYHREMIQRMNSVNRGMVPYYILARRFLLSDCCAYT